MKTPTFRLISVVALGFHFLAIPAFAAKDDVHKLSEWKIGKVLFGDKLTKTDMKGKVVVIENWGVNCPPCIASLPHLAELDKNLRDKGLRIIGAESQGSSKEEIKPLIEKAKVEYTIVDEAEGPIEVSAIPRAFVFDREGKLVYDGSPLAKPFKESITKALGDAAPAAEPATTPGAAAAPTPAAPAPTLTSMQTWTNAEGREIQAAVKSVDDTTVTFVMADGREVKYPLEKLSANSRTAITDVAKLAK